MCSVKLLGHMGNLALALLHARCLAVQLLGNQLHDFLTGRNVVERVCRGGLQLGVDGVVLLELAFNVGSELLQVPPLVLLSILQVTQDVGKLEFYGL